MKRFWVKFKENNKKCILELNIYKDGSFKLINNLRFNETVKSYHKDYKEEHPSIILKNNGEVCTASITSLVSSKYKLNNK